VFQPEFEKSLTKLSLKIVFMFSCYFIWTHEMTLVYQWTLLIHNSIWIPHQVLWHLIILNLNFENLNWIETKFEWPYKTEILLTNNMNVLILVVYSFPFSYLKVSTILKYTNFSPSEDRLYQQHWLIHEFSLPKQYIPVLQLLSQ